MKSNWKAILIIFLVLGAILTAGGCTPRVDPGTEPGDDPGTDPGGDPGTDPGGDPGTDPGESPGTAPEEDPLAVTAVPQDNIGLIERAVIHLGDLWLGTANRWWRQTDSGGVTDIVWAPNGSGLVYLRTTPNMLGQELYYLAQGGTPVLLDQNVQANAAWHNKGDWLWSPDSDSVAYAIADGSEMVTIWIQDMTKSILSLSKPCGMGPYWLSPGLLVYSTDAERPEVVVINAIGQVQETIQDASLPYPLPQGMLVATGLYDPDGIMDTFYYSGLARINDDGSGSSSVYDQSIEFHLMARDPVLPHGLTQPRYLAISSPKTLFLKQYGGVISKRVPTTVELLTQDLYLTYSEFAYPFWFAWAPDGSNIASLRYTATQTGSGSEAGYWDLVLVNKQAVRQVLLEKIYTVKDQETPVPFQYQPPLNWSQDSKYINYLLDRNDEEGLDWWQINANTGSATLVLEKSRLPEYRPQP